MSMELAATGAGSGFSVSLHEPERSTFLPFHPIRPKRLTYSENVNFDYFGSSAVVVIAENFSKLYISHPTLYN